MENGKYLNEEVYQKNNQKVKKVGKLLLIVGVILLVVGLLILILGFAGFGNTFNDNINTTQMAKGAFGSLGIIALGGFINFIGFGLTAAGGAIMLIAHKREIAAFTTQQVMPVAQEGIEKIAPSVGKAGASIAKEMAPVYGDIAKEISKGIKEGSKESENKETVEENN